MNDRDLLDELDELHDRIEFANGSDFYNHSRFIEAITEAYPQLAEELRAARNLGEAAWEYKHLLPPIVQQMVEAWRATQKKGNLE